MARLETVFTWSVQEEANILLDGNRILSRAGPFWWFEWEVFVVPMTRA